jgi:hypothetical protein
VIVATLVLACEKKPTEVLPKLAVSPSVINLASDATEASLDLTNDGGKTLTWFITADKSWITLLPKSSGEGNQVITVHVDRDTLLPGANTGNLSIASNGGDLVVPVAAQVTAGLNVSPARLDFGSDYSAKYLSISNTGSGRLNWKAITTAPWLSLTPSSGSDSSLVTVSVASNQLLGADPYATVIDVEGVDGGVTPVAVPVTADPLPTGIAFSANGLPAALAVYVNGDSKGVLASPNGTLWVPTDPSFGTQTYNYNFKQVQCGLSTAARSVSVAPNRITSVAVGRQTFECPRVTGVEAADGKSRTAILVKWAISPPQPDHFEIRRYQTSIAGDCPCSWSVRATDIPGGDRTWADSDVGATRDYYYVVRPVWTCQNGLDSDGDWGYLESATLISRSGTYSDASQTCTIRAKFLIYGMEGERMTQDSYWLLSGSGAYGYACMRCSPDGPCTIPGCPRGPMGLASRFEPSAGRVYVEWVHTWHYECFLEGVWHHASFRLFDGGRHCDSDAMAAAERFYTFGINMGAGALAGVKAEGRIENDSAPIAEESIETLPDLPPPKAWAGSERVDR